MSTLTPAGAKPRWLGVPTMNASDADLRAWFEIHLNALSPRRRWRTQRAAENLWFYLGRQWIEAQSTLAPGNGAYHFTEVYRQSDAAFPRPVTNFIAPAVDNEVSRLARKEYVPDTSAGKNEPEWMAASRLSKDILMHEIAKQVWDEKREHLIFNMVIDSIAICRTWWDENDVETTLLAAPDAAHCPMCKKRFASTRVPRSFATLGVPSDGDVSPLPMQWADTAEEVPQTGEMTAGQAGTMAQIKMRHCPFCEAQTALQPYEMNEEEALEEDVFGRPMGLSVPRGEGLIDVISLHEYFPENGGLAVEPYGQKIFMQEKVRPLEWIALRLPEFRDTLSPEDSALLMRSNPLYADPAFTGLGNRLGYGAGTGNECYYNHARVREVVITPQPIPGLEKGAHFFQVNDQVARRELCLEVEGEDGKFKMIPRVKYHFARFKRVPGNFDGRTFVDDMKSLQRRLNEVDSQSIDLRERGKPVIWTPAGTEIYVRDDMGGALNVVEYDAALTSWTPQGSIFPGVPLSGAAYAQERAQIIQDMQKIGFPQDIEMGQSPGSVKTTSGLMLLSEEASQKRAPRERALINLYESAFEHLLQLNWALRKEDAEYEVAEEGGLFERKSFTGTDLLGNIRVKMNARAGYDQTLYNKEAAAEALQMGLYKLDSPAAIDRILDLMKLPKDVNENQTLQIGRAEMAWSDFMREKKVPAIDVTLFDPLTWYSVLGKRWLTDQAYIKQNEAGWTALIPRLVLWPQKMAEMEAAEQQVIMYKNVPQEQWGMVFEQGSQMVAQANQAYQQAMESFNQASAGSQIAGQPPPMPPMPPPMQEFPAPPQVPFLPDPLEQKIYTVWRRMLPELEAALQAAATAQELESVMAAVPEAAKIMELEALMRMRAVIEAFRLMSQPPGMMGPPPPGGGAPTGPPPPGGGPGGPPPGGPGPTGPPGPPPPGA